MDASFHDPSGSPGTGTQYGHASHSDVNRQADAQIRSFIFVIHDKLETGPTSLVSRTACVLRRMATRMVFPPRESLLLLSPNASHVLSAGGCRPTMVYLDRSPGLNPCRGKLRTTQVARGAASQGTSAWPNTIHRNPHPEAAIANSRTRADNPASIRKRTAGNCPKRPIRTNRNPGSPKTRRSGTSVAGLDSQGWMHLSGRRIARAGAGGRRAVIVARARFCG